MTASIIIPVFNRENLIRECLLSLLHQTSDDYEIIVVDDGSTDGTKQVLETFTSENRIRIFYLENNKGPAYARNFGVQKSLGQWIGFIDSDCIASPDWLKEILKPFEGDDCVMITAGKTIDPSPSNYWEAVNKGENFISNHSGYVSQAVGCNMAVRRTLLMDTPFDETIPTSAGEEIDLCFSCLKKGFKIFYTSDAKVTHFRRSSLAQTLKQQFSYGFYNTYVRLKHKQFPYINYGTWLLGLIFLCTILGFHSIASLLLIVYFGFIFFVDVRLRQKPLLEAVIYYPGFLAACLANAAGNVCYLLNIMKRKAN